jgi:hypothetical protein
MQQCMYAQKLVASFWPMEQMRMCALHGTVLFQRASVKGTRICFNELAVDTSMTDFTTMRHIRKQYSCNIPEIR